MTRIFSPLASRASAAGLPVFPVAPVITIMVAPLVARVESRRSGVSAATTYQMRELFTAHRDFYTGLFREGNGVGITGVHVAGDADAGIIGQHALNAFAHFFRAVGDRHLAGVQRVANAHAAAIVY